MVDIHDLVLGFWFLGAVVLIGWALWPPRRPEIEPISVNELEQIVREWQASKGGLSDRETWAKDALEREDEP